MKNEETSVSIINRILQNYSSIREFCRIISECESDMTRWRQGKGKIKARAVISICRIYQDILPYQLNPYVFPKDLSFKFGDNIEENTNE